MAIQATTKTYLENLERKIDYHINQSTSSDERMNRIEDKIDHLADAVISIARAEEKIAGLMQNTKDIKTAIIQASDKIQLIEIQTINNTSDLRTLNKFFWLIATTTITVAATALALTIGIL
jgi:phosphosulfolactate synthase (CoM biosynthesis protein A)